MQIKIGAIATLAQFDFLGLMILESSSTILSAINVSAMKMTAVFFVTYSIVQLTVSVNKEISAYLTVSLLKCFEQCFGSLFVLRYGFFQ